MPKKPITKEKALERLMGLCSRSEQCEHDLMLKLLNWGITQSERREVIEYLKENRFVDDARYANSFANDKAKFSNWGPFKIRMELVKKKIPGSLIKSALENVDAKVWKEGLLRNAESKSKNLNLSGEEGYENRQKLFRYLITRGFPTASVSKAVAYIKKRQEEE